MSSSRARDTRLLVGIGAVLTALLSPATPAAAQQAPTLVTDAAGRPLLVGGQLRPGHSLQNCLLVSYTQEPGALSELAMFAAIGGDGLAEYLELTVEAGAGGGFGDCAGFTGERLFQGTLSSFGDQHRDGATPLRVSQVAEPTGGLTFRLTVTLRGDNRAQGRSGSATFSWLAAPIGPGTAPPAPVVDVPLLPDPSEPAPSEPTPQPSAPASRAPLPSTAGTPPAASVPVASRPERSTRDLTVAAPLSGVTAPRPTATATTNSIVDQLRTVIDRLVTSVAEAAPAAAKGGAFGLATLPLLLLFLLVQRRIDKQDPKLALAPSYQDAFLSFDDVRTRTPAGSGAS